MKDLEIYLSSDQPTTCPKCGNRTEILKESENLQIHQCLLMTCSFKFILEFEEDL